MSSLLFNRSSSKIILKNSSSTQVGAWDAANNVDSSYDPWPDGSYTFAYPKRHSDDGPDSAFGSYGIMVFNVTGRQGMGVHSGRRNSHDGLGRTGYQYATNGCIRTTDEAMAKIVEVHGSDPLESINVTEAGVPAMSIVAHMPEHFAPLFEKAVGALKQANVSDRSDNIKFFPDGIRYVDFTFAAGTKEAPGFSVRLTVSGEKPK